MDGFDAEAYRAVLMENMEYSILADRHGRDRMDEVVEILLEVLLSRREYIRVAGDEFPVEVVRGRLLKVDSSHVEYVFECLDRNAPHIRNIKAYLLTALYNAPATINSHYRAEANHDFGGTSRV